MWDKQSSWTHLLCNMATQPALLSPALPCPALPAVHSRLLKLLLTTSAGDEAPLLCSGLHETLYMTVAIPLLWGIPPRHESLRYVAHGPASCLGPAGHSHVLRYAVLLSSLAEVWWKRCTDNGSCMNRLIPSVYIATHFLPALLLSVVPYVCTPNYLVQFQHIYTKQETRAGCIH